MIVRGTDLQECPSNSKKAVNLCNFNNIFLGQKEGHLVRQVTKKDRQKDGGKELPCEQWTGHSCDASDQEQ